MSVYGIVTGELIRVPERRTSKGGKTFVTKQKARRVHG